MYTYVTIASYTTTVATYNMSKYLRIKLYIISLVYSLIFVAIITPLLLIVGALTIMSCNCSGFVILCNIANKQKT